ncbi:pyridoxal phosphate-dependent aminotransferase [Acutalibacter muris]|uniref:cysteine-S-conjugate beta-lyase n=1 Tax=Acutalibacter muris TaxID=1796620 RepID=A0A1Z2XNS4_9FIRM|nr:MalY/PatB family protein [Acutalibacter muris]ANU53244.1 aminotransferase [Hungateiclostridiaceae bacterium KB18]ASB40083.1 pyridoxal phosphate-dependent aminotransferase [Acutalibacter muris]QQR29372.1 pyridoxal phosphate-dependent aminotransferase [Acutalibacter muris]
MKYDFTTLIDRSTHGSGKWDGMREKKPELKYSPVPLSVADMEFKNPPEIAEGLKEFMDTHILGYTGPTKEYYDAVCAWMERRHNWHIEPDWIVGTHGVVEALKVSVEAYCKPGEGVITFTPVYYPFYMAIEGHGCKVARCPLIYKDNTYIIDFDLFEKLCAEENNKMLLLCSPHNPVGRVWSAEELTRICDICRKHKVRIISDEIHFDIIMPGFKHTTIHNVAKPSDNIIVCTAPSKTFNLATMQTSNIIIPDEEDRKRFKEILGFGGPSALGLEACRIAYTRCEEWAKEMVQVIDGNRQAAVDFIAERLPEIKAIELQGTYLLWLDCTALGKNKEELENMMVEAELFLDEGYMFGDEGIGFERVNLAVPRDELMKALERLEKAVKG